MKKLGTLIILLSICKIGFGQNTPLLPEEDWGISNYIGTCYHDTIIHAVWLYIDPGQTLRKYQNDSSFIVVEVTVVNNSPIDIYLRGDEERLGASVVKETYVTDTALINSNREYTSRMGVLPWKLDRNLAFSMDDLLKNPHKDLWSRKNTNSLITIPKDTRKKLLVTMPKREGNYRAEIIVEFNKEKVVLGCDGQDISGQIARTIESNKIKLKENKR